MFHLIVSNRYDALAEVLLDRLAGAPPGARGTRAVFDAHQVIVPSSGIRRSIELGMADRHGICANVAFDFLAQWIWRLVGRVVPVAPVSPFAPATLRWHVLDWLGSDAGLPPVSSARLRSYLGQAEPAMRFALAERVASLFDHYLTYRSDWLDQWSAGRSALPAEHAAEEGWQAALWRDLTERLQVGRRHPVLSLVDALAADPDAARSLLPAAIHVFALPAAPPVYLDAIRALSERTDVHVYALNPCREYWFDIADDRQIVRLREAAASRRDASGQGELFATSPPPAAAGGLLDPDTGFRDVGNPLLAAWGSATQAYLTLLQRDDTPRHDQEIFVDAITPDAPSLLARVQDAILDLKPLREDEAPPLVLATDDRSIELHVCHSMQRELEALQDRLLGLLAADSTLGPEQILVLTPDLVDTAPSIEAVFGTAPPERYLPYRITGLPPTQSNRVAAALCTLLELLDGRAGASELFDLLEMPAVATRLGLDGDARERIRGWIRDAGIRWSLDARMREDMDLAQARGFGFDDGLARLFLAYSQGDEPAASPLHGGMAPEGSDALLLGTFWRFVESLRVLRERAAHAMPASQWRELLVDAIQHLCADGSSRNEAAGEALRAGAQGLADEWVAASAAIASLATEIETATPDARLPLAVVRDALVSRFDAAARGAVPAGCISFGALGALRGPAYRVVCLIGLDDQAFPRHERPLEFDLIARQPRRGDRQRRDDDRNTFLEALLSAREYLHLSHTGRSARDNTERPPSVLVSELLDHLVGAIASDGGDAAQDAVRSRLIVEHPLQPFSPACFGAAGADPRLASFDIDSCAAVRARAATISDPARTPVASSPFFPSALAEDTDIDVSKDVGVTEGGHAFAGHAASPGVRGLPLEQLLAFFRNPARALLVGRLGLSMPRRVDELADDEPFVPDGLGLWQLDSLLVPVALAGGDRDALMAIARAGAYLPPGPIGALVLEESIARVRAFADVVRPALGESATSCGIAIDLDVDDRRWRIEGTLGDCTTDGLVRHRAGRLRAVDLVSAWIEHLCLCAAKPDVPVVTRMIGLREQRRFTHCAPDAARAHLAGLVGLQRDGLRVPLAFFPEVSWALAIDPGGRREARNAWARGRPGIPPVADSPEIALAWRGQPEPLGPDFERIAHAVLDPLAEHLDASCVDSSPAAVAVIARPK
ncbi:MAG: exodeoxyribonuclease V subunit gamma [Burkholderiaceae bacterium]|nr:exodeoxyribonuclease V subunit gamma [Burkholderiaceae bacterium]